MQAYLIDGIRTPIGSFGGSLAPVRTDDLAAHAIQKLLERHPNLGLSAPIGTTERSQLPPVGGAGGVIADVYLG